MDPWLGGHEVLFAAASDFVAQSRFDSHALTVSLNLFLLKAQVFHLTWREHGSRQSFHFCLSDDWGDDH